MNNQADNILGKGVRYFEFSQPGGTFFACTIRADQIVGLLDIRRRSDNPSDGIQRDDNARRVADIAEYSNSDDAIFPTPIIVSARSEDFVFKNGELRVIGLTSKRSVGHVLDGQHRILGLRGAAADIQRRISLLIVFAFDIDRYAEALIFATINGNQRQVPKSLMYDLFSLHPGRSIEKTCHEIVKSLNEDSTSPFHARIKMLGRKANDSETLSQAAFVDHVRLLIDGDKAPLRQLYLSKEDWAIRKIVATFFSALDSSVEESEREQDDLRTFFYRTTGFGGAVKALVVLAKAGVIQGDLSKDWFRPITNRFVQHFKTPKGVGNSAMLDVQDQLVGAAEVVTGLSLK
jgi:DGQHR domain-containing protein